MEVIAKIESNLPTKIKLLIESEAKDIPDFEGKAKEITTRYQNDETIIYAALGEKDDDNEITRTVVANAIRVANRLKREAVAIEIRDAKQAAVVAEAAVLGNYSYDVHKKEPASKLQTIEIIGKDIDATSVENATIIAKATLYSRDLINGNAGDIIPARLAEEAREIAKGCSDIALEILTEKEIQKKGLGLLWAVGKGSTTLPRLILMNYKGDPSSEESVAVVGKGVTFDTGGMNLKPSGSIETMRSDMGGAAATLGIMKALATLKPKINVIGVVPSACNAIGPEAYYTGDVFTSYNGTTVEVLNTDAEGRLILADAISYCKENYKPTEMIDMATLTGAVLIALGDTVAGIFSNDDTMAKELFESGENVGEPVWQLPIREEHREWLKSDIADIQNISKVKRSASSITAAAFLEHFVEDTPWTHIDIAGTSWNDREARGIFPKHASGFGVRLILDYLLNK